MDFAKAFETVPHERLKDKRFHYSVNGNTLGRIDALSCHRRQSVLINGAKSEWISVSSGVPQRTVLGPILLNVVINDIVNNANSGIRIFGNECV